MNAWILLGASGIVAYLLGSFPTSYLVGRWLKGIDIRRHGSGNVGATNVTRVVGKLPGFFVLLVDIAKGWAAVDWVAPWASGVGIPLATLQPLLGLCAVCGHLWCPFLGFAGGKGVATAAGVLIGLSPGLAILAAAVWTGTALLTRYVSVSSIVAVTVIPIVMAVTHRPLVWVAVSIALCGLIVLRHRANLSRLLRNEEPRIGHHVNDKINLQ